MITHDKSVKHLTAYTRHKKTSFSLYIYIFVSVEPTQRLYIFVSVEPTQRSASLITHGPKPIIIGCQKIRTSKSNAGGVWTPWTSWNFVVISATCLVVI